MDDFIGEMSFVEQEQIKTPNLRVHESNVTNRFTNFQKCPKTCMNSNKIVLSELTPKKTIYFHFAISASVSQKNIIPLCSLQ